MPTDPPPPPRAGAAPPRRRRAPALAPCLALLVLAGVLCAERWHTRREPLERDMPTYAVVANEVLHGRPLYLGVFDQKPPAVYLTYAAAEILTGYDRRTVFGLGLFAALITLPGVYLVGRSLTGRAAYGLCAAGLWAVLGSDLDLEANQPNTEAFMNASVVWALFLLARSRRDVVRWPSALGIGLLFAWASLYKPVVITEAAGLMVAYALRPPGGAASRPRALRRGAAVAATVCAVWALVTGFFVAEGHGRAFYEAMVVYNRYYAGSLARNLAAAFNSVSMFPPFLNFCLPLVALDVAGFAASARRGLSWQWASLLGLALGTYAAIVLPGRLFPHYFQLWLPLLCVAPVYGLAALARTRLGRRPRLLAAVGLPPLLLVLAHEAAFYRLSATQWSLRKYKTEFVEADRAGRELRALLGPQETFYDASVAPELYLETGKRPPSGIFYAEPLDGGPFVPAFTARVLHDLGAAPPQVVVVYTRSSLTPNPAIVAWTKAHYSPLPASPAHPRYVFWVLRGGALDARLRRG